MEKTQSIHIIIQFFKSSPFSKVGYILFLLCWTSCSDTNKMDNKNDNESQVLAKTESLNHTTKKDKHEKKKKTKESKSNHAQWSYDGETGPAFWAEIEKNSACDGFKQSPINIITTASKVQSNLSSIHFHYKPSTHITQVVNNGHTIKYDFDEGDYLYFGKDRFDLKQIHFHEPAEHTINGIRYPLVIHMVHAKQDHGFLVLAVMVYESETSEPFTFLEKFLPIEVGESKTIDTAFDLTQNLPVDKGYYTYQGSLTTPPCTENVTWVVFKTPISASLDQVKKLRALMPKNNYREEQPLNGREVLMTASDQTL